MTIGQFTDFLTSEAIYYVILAWVVVCDIIMYIFFFHLPLEKLKKLKLTDSLHTKANISKIEQRSNNGAPYKVITLNFDARGQNAEIQLVMNPNQAENINEGESINILYRPENHKIAYFEDYLDEHLKYKQKTNKFVIIVSSIFLIIITFLILHLTNNFK